MVAAIAEAAIGPKPGMLISRRAVSSCCASFAMVRSRRTIASSRFRNCTTSGASASHTSNGIVSSQSSINSASSRACRGPCAAITPISVKCPRSPLSSCVRCETNISRGAVTPTWIGRRADLRPRWRLATSRTLRLLGREACGGK